MVIWQMTTFLNGTNIINSLSLSCVCVCYKRNRIIIINFRFSLPVQPVLENGKNPIGIKKKIFSLVFPSSRLLTWNQITYRYDDRSTVGSKQQKRADGLYTDTAHKHTHTLSSFFFFFLGWLKWAFSFLLLLLLWLWLCVCVFCSLDYTQQLVRLTSQWRRLSGWFGISKNTHHTRNHRRPTRAARDKSKK